LCVFLRKKLYRLHTTVIQKFRKFFIWLKYWPPYLNQAEIFIDLRKIQISVSYTCNLYCWLVQLSIKSLLVFIRDCLGFIFYFMFFLVFFQKVITAKSSIYNLYKTMNGLTIRELCCLFCCPPCPSRIASKLAFLPPTPTYTFQHDEACTRFTLHLTERSEWHYTQRELDCIEVCAFS